MPKAKPPIYNRATGEHETPKGRIQYNSADWWRNFLDGSPSREEVLDIRLNQALDGTELETSKLIGDYLSGMVRRT